MSFRLKIFLAMLLLVAAVTAAALFVAERSLRSAFEDAQEARYAERATAMANAREARLSEVTETARAFARSVRVNAALTEYDIDHSGDALEILHQTARDELLKPGAATRGWTCLLVDAAGARISSPDAGADAALSWNPAPALLKATLDKREPVSGYVPSADGRSLFTAVFQPMKDGDDGQPAGGVLLAGPPADTDADAMGLRAGGRWFGTVLPGIVTAAVPENVAEGRFTVTGGDEPYLVFARRISQGGLFPACDEIAAFSMAASLEQRRVLRQRVLLGGAAAVVLAALLGMAFSHTLTAPVRDLTVATQRVRRGDFAARATVRRRDELGRLTEAFNEMAGDLALKEKYRNVLDVVSDPRVAEALLAGGLELGGEDRQVSVVFCDIRGFTPLTEGMQPSEVIQLLNEHFTPLTRVVYDYGGVVLQFVGDLIMAVFNAPAQCEEHASTAIACALALVAERARLNDTGARRIEVGVGVATGAVVAGRMGSADRLNYSVLGARVNLAARLCSQAAPMQIIADEATVLACGGGLAARPMGELKLKGFSEAVSAYEITPLPAAAEA